MKIGWKYSKLTTHMVSDIQGIIRMLESLMEKLF
jgi:hypothetical protein